MVKLRAARPGEEPALSALVLRSKAHWGYDAEFLAACAGELRVRPGDLGSRRIVVAEDGRGLPLGLASLEGAAPRAVLGLLFVEPSTIGRGVGRLLHRDAVRRAATLGVRTLVIDSDPHAAGSAGPWGRWRWRCPGPRTAAKARAAVRATPADLSSLGRRSEPADSDPCVINR